MSGSWPPEIDAASLGLALAVGIAASIPLWTLSLWMAISATLWRWMAARNWIRWFAAVSALAAALLWGSGFAWAYSTLLGPNLPTEQRIVYVVWLVSGVLGLVGIGWGKKKHRGAAGTPPRAVPQRRGPVTILIVLLVWIVLAGVFAALEFGPLATEPPSSRDRAVLGLGALTIATLVAALVRATRGGRTKDGGSIGRK